MYGSNKFRIWNRFPGCNKGSSATEMTSTTQNYSPEESARRTQVMDEAMRVYGNTQGLIADKPYPGAAPVPFSAESLAAQELQTQNAFNAQGQLADVNAAQQYALTGAMDVNNNPWLAKAVQGAINPITQDWTDTGGVMSSIRDNGTNSGQFGSSRQGIAEGIAAGRYAQAVGDTSSKMYSAAYDKGQDTMLKGIALAPQTMDLAATPVSWLSTVGAQKETMDQELAQYQADASMWDINSQWAPLNNLSNIIYGGGSSTATTTNNQPGAPTNRAAGAIGGAMAGYAMGPAVASMFATTAAGTTAGTAAGAAGGAQMGSSAGIWGAAAGAVLGALLA